MAVYAVSIRTDSQKCHLNKKAMKKLKLNIEQVTDLWWCLRGITQGLYREDYQALFEMQDRVVKIRESYRVAFPRDPDLLAFIAACREIQKEEETQERKEKLSHLKEVNQDHVKTLKEFYKELRRRESLEKHLEFEPLSEGDLPSDIKEEHLATLSQLIIN